MAPKSAFTDAQIDMQHGNDTSCWVLLQWVAPSQCAHARLVLVQVSLHRLSLHSFLELWLGLKMRRHVRRPTTLLTDVVDLWTPTCSFNTLMYMYSYTNRRHVNALYVLNRSSAPWKSIDWPDTHAADDAPDICQSLGRRILDCRRLPTETSSRRCASSRSSSTTTSTPAEGARLWRHVTRSYGWSYPEHHEHGSLLIAERCDC